MSSGRTVFSTDRINLERISFLLLDDNLQSLDIMSSAVAGFGVRNITDAEMPEESGYDFLRWVRHEASEPNKFVPAIICTGHTRQSQVMQARDCGAHFLVVKPITPKVLLDRIFWVARDERSFVECETYAGPDRRFKRLGPPAGMQGRRKDDLTGAIGAATEPNLSQDEINSFMKPAKVVL